MQLGQGLAAIAGFADHADVAGGGQEGSQALTDDTVVVGDEHADGAVSGRCAHVAPSWSGGTPAGTVAVIVVPRPGALATSRRPPRRVTRSRMEARPRCPGRPRAESKPIPSSWMTTMTSEGPEVTATEAAT